MLHTAKIPHSRNVIGCPTKSNIETHSKMQIVDVSGNIHTALSNVKMCCGVLEKAKSSEYAVN